MTNSEATSSALLTEPVHAWQGRRGLWWRTAYLAAVLLFLVYPFTGSVFRDNDQAAFLRGAWDLAHHTASFWHGASYNYDKQWGTYLALDLVDRCFPYADPVFAGNLMQVILISLAWMTLALRTGRNRSAPFPLLLPVLASPALVLYAPYLGTAWISLAFLLIAFFLMGFRSSKYAFGAALVSVGVASACRADVLLAIPALLLTQASRTSLASLLKRPVTWLGAAACILPILFGKWIDANPAPDTNPLGFELKPYLALLLFGFTPACLSLLAWSEAAHLTMAVNHPRFRVYYGLTAVAILIPLVFYSLQLYTIRYFFLTLACLLFSASSRRTSLLYRAQRARFGRRATFGVVAFVSLTIMPWLLGVQLKTLWHPRLTVSNPTRLPTGDGHFPLGAYLAFESQSLFKDHLQIDHNQKIWLSARSVNYQVCSDGTVPLLWSPMVNYLAFAATLNAYTPRTVRSIDDHCDIVYADLRSLSRSVDTDDSEANRIFRQDVTVVSHRPDLCQPIVRISSNGKASQTAQILRTLRGAFGGRETEIYFSSGAGSPISSMKLDPAVDTLDFSVRGACHANAPVGWSSMPVDSAVMKVEKWMPSTAAFPALVNLTCAGPYWGWAATVVPPFMSVSHAFATQAYGHPIGQQR